MGTTPTPSMLLGICGHIHGPERRTLILPGHQLAQGGGHGSSQVGTAEGTCPLGYPTWAGTHMALWPPPGRAARGCSQPEERERRLRDTAWQQCEPCLSLQPPQEITYPGNSLSHTPLFNKLSQCELSSCVLNPKRLSVLLLSWATPLAPRPAHTSSLQATSPDLSGLLKPRPRLLSLCQAPVSFICWLTWLARGSSLPATTLPFAGPSFSTEHHAAGPDLCCQGQRPGFGPFLRVPADMYWSLLVLALPHLVPTFRPSCLPCGLHALTPDLRRQAYGAATSSHVF